MAELEPVKLVRRTTHLKIDYLRDRASYIEHVSLVIHSDCIRKEKRKKIKHIETDNAEQQIEQETGDIYYDAQRGEMLKADGITAAENAFMQGRERTPKKKKNSLT